MAFASATAKIWPVPPDWAKGVSESLAWSTDYVRASATASTQHRALREFPRRQLSFPVLAQAQARRTAAMLLAGYTGTWQLPIWPDVQWLPASVDVGSTGIPCATAGYDFAAGGKALLYSAVNDFELLSIDTVEADQITLSAATTSAFAPGSRLYPLRAARLQDKAQERLLNDDIGQRSLAFDITAPCAWPVLEDLTTYLGGHPVLDRRPDEGDDPTASIDRLVQAVDYGNGTPVEHDLAQFGIGTWQLHWQLFGRAAHTWFRSLAYTLAGRAMPIWVPSFTSDLKPSTAIAGGSTTLYVEWAGYTLFGKGQHNRRDLRIELTDGRTLNRRITDSVEAGATETLTLDSALDAGSIQAAQIRCVSFMALATLASDTVELQHETDAEGLATATTGFQAVLPDV